LKKKLLAIFVLISLISSIFTIGLNAGKNLDIKEKTESIIFSELKIQEKNNYITLNLEEAPLCLMRPGEPILPVYTKTFKFPFGTQIKEVKCKPSQIYKKVISGEIKPSPIPIPLINKNNKVGKNLVETSVIKDNRVYKNTNFFPYKWYDYSVGCGLDGSDHVVILTIRFYPVSYSPIKNTIQYAKKVDINVKYFEQIYPVIFNDKYDMVIIAPSEYSEKLQPLVEYKKDCSIDTISVSLDDIYNGTYFDVQGRDNQEKIKYFIKDAIEEWNIEYVLLAGGANKIPVRMSYVQDGWEESFISDLYYADIYDSKGDFCSWDSNDNDIFGEYNYEGRTDIVDLYPDIRLGRLNFRKIGEISGVVSKLITYESTGAYMETWFSNFVVCGGDTFPDSMNVDEGEYLNENAINYMDDFHPDKIWATNGRLQFAINIDNAIKNGSGFLYMTGHGTYENWATHPHNNFDIWWPLGSYFYSRVELLKNWEKIPVVIIGGCSNCEFLDNNCFGWSFVKNPEGGGVASYGNSAVGWGYTGYACTQGLTGGMELSAFKAYGDQNAKTTGELWVKALNNYLIDFGVWSAHGYKTVEEWQAFNDPSLRIFKISNKPNRPEIPEGPTYGEIGIEYSYTTSTTDPDGDLVKYCFDWGDNTVTWTDQLESGENASLNHTWDIPGDHQIKVKARDENGLDSEWSDPLSIYIDVNSPFISIEKIRGGFGKVIAKIKNIGTLEASNVNWSISVSGGTFGLINVFTENTIDIIEVEVEEKIKTSGIIFGFGNIEVNVTAMIPAANTATKTVNGFVFGPFVLLQK